ncbi:MAG: hypothetical protein NW217_07075 [Hyphomicrobiaceae bacterium]|nr:hypothetical protein [Hyphomicrobiaceae bacterium]
MATILEFPDNRGRTQEKKTTEARGAAGRVLLFTGIRHERHAIPDPERLDRSGQGSPPAHERN